MCYSCVVSKRPYSARAVISLLQSLNILRIEKKRHCCRPVSSAALFPPSLNATIRRTVCSFVCCSFFPLARAYFLIHIFFSYNSQSTLFITHIHTLCAFSFHAPLLTVSVERANETENWNPTSHFFRVGAESCCFTIYGNGKAMIYFNICCLLALLFSLLPSSIATIPAFDWWLCWWEHFFIYKYTFNYYKYTQSIPFYSHSIFYARSVCEWEEEEEEKKAHTQTNVHTELELEQSEQKWEKKENKKMFISSEIPKKVV